VDFYCAIPYRTQLFAPLSVVANTPVLLSGRWEHCSTSCGNFARTSDGLLIFNVDQILDHQFVEIYRLPALELALLFLLLARESMSNALTWTDYYDPEPVEQND
jgi:hypothetical protein